MTHNLATARGRVVDIDSARAWVMAGAAFVAGFVVFGVIYTFGVFLLPMTTDFTGGRAAVSTLFSIAGLAFYMLGPLTGSLSDHVGPRKVVASGAVVMGAGLTATAVTDQVWVAWLSYGVGVGLGAACAYVPTLANVGGWFARRRNAALGLAAAGTGCGMLLTPPLAAFLIEQHGWRSAMAALGLLSAALLGTCALVVAPAAQSSPSPVDHTAARAVKSRPFVLMYISWLFATTALFVPFLLLPSSAVRLGADQVAASMLLSLIGGASVLGRIGIGVLAQRVGTTRLFKIAVLLMAASHVIWLAAPGYGALALFAVALGLTYGIRIALVPSMLIEFFGQRGLGTLLGIFFTSTGLAALLAPLLLEPLIAHAGSDNAGALFALVMGALGFVIIAPLRPPSQPKS